MHFVRLGPVGDTSYVPDDHVIEGYNSLIWTERFQTPGEFELKSYDVDRMMALLPEYTFVSHLETKEVMQVETHSIDWEGEGADARPEITIKGRSATSILEHRPVLSTYQTKRRMRMKYSASSALGVLLTNAVANGSMRDLTRGDTDPDTETEYNDYNWTLLDELPNVTISEAVATQTSTRWWQLEGGMLLDQFQKIMVDADLGLRMVRPTLPNLFTRIEVATALSNRGAVTRVAVQDSPKLRFEIYQGFDRTGSVQFSQLQGHLDKPNYLRSIAQLKTHIEVMSGVVAISDIFRPGESNLEGWRRRTLTIDAGTPEIPDAPEQPDRLGRNATASQRNAYYDRMDAYYAKRTRWRNKKAAIIADFKEEAKQMGLAELKKAARVNMVAGDISLLSPYAYKTHYNLGDTVTLLGDYGTVTQMVVAEYVRTEDANGDRGFPGLVLPDAGDASV